jgi:hypothetical protein
LTKIEHFDGKADIAEYTRSLGVPTTLYLPGFYSSNLPGQAIVKTENGYIFALPCDEDAQIPIVDIEADTGKYVKSIFLNKDKTLGKDVYGSGKYYTPKEIVETFEKVYPVHGKGIQFVKVSKGDYTAKLQSYGMPEKIAEELLENMLLLNREYGYYGGADLAESNAVSPWPEVIEWWLTETAPQGTIRHFGRVLQERASVCRVEVESFGIDTLLPVVVEAKNSVCICMKLLSPHSYRL